MSTERKINFTVAKRTQTDYTPFEFIIYGLKNSSSLIIEIPDTGDCTLKDQHTIRKYIRLGNITTTWKNDVFGNYYRLIDGSLEQTVNFTSEIEYFWFNFELPPHFYQIKRVLINKNILNKELDWISFSENNSSAVPVFQVRLPLLPTVGCCLMSDSYNITLKQFLQKYNGEYYKFPYGNTYDNGSMCMGGSISNNINMLFWDIITSKNNYDLNMLIRCSLSDDYSNIQGCSFKDVTILPLDKVEERLENNTNDKIDLLSMFHYLANQDPEKIPFDKIFYKCLPRWEGEI